MVTDPKFNPFDYEVYCGLDVSKKSIAVTFIERDGSVRSLKMAYDSDALIRYTEKHYGGRKVVFVYEAGPTGYGLYDDLTKARYYCLIEAPSVIPRSPGERVKTNRLDSRKLADLLRGGQIHGIHVPKDNYRQLRLLTQLRKKSAGRRTATKLQIKGLLLLQGIAFPVTEKSEVYWSKWTIEQLKTLECPAVVRFKLDCYLDQLEFWQQQVSKIQKESTRFCTQDPELSKCVQLMRTVSGIGPLTGIYLLSRIGDWRLIRNSRQIAAFFGLIPSERSTGEEVNRGSITRMGDRVARAMLIEAAWVAIRKDPELQEVYLRIFNANNRDKNASKLAIVAIARKLTTRIYAVLKQQKPYQVRSAMQKVI